MPPPPCCHRRAVRWPLTVANKCSATFATCSKNLHNVAPCCPFFSMHTCISSVTPPGSSPSELTEGANRKLQSPANFIMKHKCGGQYRPACRWGWLDGWLNGWMGGWMPKLCDVHHHHSTACVGEGTLTAQTICAVLAWDDKFVLRCNPDGYWQL